MAEFEWDDTPKTSGSTTPKRKTRRTKTFYKSQCSSLVAIGNVILTLSSPGDTLADDEMDMLTDALVAECTASDRIAAWLERAAGISPHVLLIKAVGLIAIPRLQRRGLIPSFGGEDEPTGGTMTNEQKASYAMEQLSKLYGVEVTENADNIIDWEKARH